MSYPPSYNANPLQAIVVIKNLAGTEVYRYEMPNIVAAAAVQNFPMTGVSISAGVNENYGTATIFINDNTRAFIENIGGVPLSLFKSGWTIEIFCGKDVASVSLWALAIIQDVHLTFGTNSLFQELHCNLYGIRLQQRLSLMQRSQDRLNTDLITPDPADESTFISQLFIDTLTKTDHLAAPGMGQLDITTGNVNTIAISIAEYQKNLVSFGSILSELASMGFCYYGVDANKVAYLYKRQQVDSGFLISNDVNPAPTDTSNWNPNKLMIFRNRPIVIRDQTSDSGYSILHAVGSQRLQVDHSNTTAKNADLNTNANFYAFPFTPIGDNIAEISIRLARNSVIASDLQVSIVGEVAGKPNLSNVRKAVVIRAARLEDEIILAGKFLNIKIDKIPVARGEKLFVVLGKTTNAAANALVAPYNTGSGSYFESSDGITWGAAQTGNYLFITYNSKSVRIIAENGIASKTLLPKEGILNLPDTPNVDTVLKILEAILESVTKVIRNFEPITVSPPTSPPELGKSFRLIDIITGMDTEMDLIAWDLSINTNDESNRGATEMTVHFQGEYT